MLNFDCVVIMLNDTSETETKHLPINILEVSGHNAILRQMLLADFIMSPTGLALHPAHFGTVWIEIIARWHYNSKVSMIEYQAATCGGL